MSQVMVIGILVLIYMVYLITGLHYQFPVGWLDWVDPYFHYETVKGGGAALNLFVAPLIAFIWLGYLWYHKSMIGES